MLSFLVVMVCLVLSVWWMVNRTERILIVRRFGLSPLFYKCESTDLAGKTPAVKCRLGASPGIPDGVFIRRFGRRLVVGEHKSRRCRGGVKWEEYFQLLAYMGCIAESRRLLDRQVSGVLCFADTTVSVPFSREAFAMLRAVEKHEFRKLSFDGVHNSSEIRLPLYKRKGFPRIRLAGVKLS